MALDRHELFKTLLIKLHLDSLIQQKPYSTGLIEKLEVHVKSKLWCLYINLESILPYQQFVRFYKRLQACFEDVARLKLIIKVTKPRLTNQLIQSYWGWVLKHCDLSQSIAMRMSQQFQPIIKDHRILLITSNEVIKNYLQKQDLRSIPQTYMQLGFPQLNIVVKIKQKSSRDLKKLHHERRKSDAKVIKSATNSVKKKREKRRLQSMGIGQLIDKKNPVVPIESLHHESRSVTIEGIVKVEEVQPLISRRKLLLITLADQTAAIKVKIFAKNRGGQEASVSIKKGMHLKVQGAVRSDQATQDLMVNAYNINLLTTEEK